MKLNLGIVIVLMLLVSCFGRGVAADCEWLESPLSCAYSLWLHSDDPINIQSLNNERREDIVRRWQMRSASGEDDWIGAGYAFGCAYLLASRDDLVGSRKEELLNTAILAVKRGLQRNPDSMVFPLAISNLHHADRWFVRKLLKLFDQPELAFQHEAIRYHCLSLLHEALGNNNQAHEASETAYTLCPEDSVISNRIRTMRKRVGDYEGSLDAIAESEVQIEPKRMSSIWRKAQDELDKAEVFAMSGDLESAALHCQKSWDTLDGLQAMKDDLKATGPVPLCLLRNKCATVRGLIAIEKADLKSAEGWLKASLTDGVFVKMMGYDLRLAEKLVLEPSARAKVIRYLEVAKLHGPDDTRTQAEKLLHEIKATDGPTI